MPVRTLGVEEELMLVDPATGRLAAVSQHAVRANEDPAEVEHELFLQQIETSTPPCLTSDDLLAGIRNGRAAVGKAAAAAGARAVAMPTPVLLEEGEDFTPKTRYQRIRSEYGELARQSLVGGMHVHVGVGSDREGVRVIDAIRPWLPLLTALSGNSPFWQGRDTGHASWRSQTWGRWPTAGVNEPFGDVATYRSVAARMTDWGAGLDPGMLYFDVRLSEKYPTVEIRVADVCTDVEDVLLVALLPRSLFAAATTDRREWRTDLLRVASWRAARFGLAGDLVHPTKVQLAGPRDVFAAALDHCRPALEESGDAALVVDLFERLLARGAGAARQRRVHEATGSLDAVVHDLADRTEESWAG
jgi:glutamate---cysteine ligase / carboxylate-amine ligase